MAKLLIWLKRLWHSVYRPDKVMYIGGSDVLPAAAALTER